MKDFFENPSSVLTDFATFYSKMGVKKSIICKVTHNFEDIQKGISILEAIFHNIEDEQLKEYASFETLAKVIAYRNLKKGHIIPISVIYNRKAEITNYVVDHVFTLWKGVKAFGLVSESKKVAPIILFRGTDFSFITESGRASMLGDLDPSGPGWTVFSEGEKSILSWVRQQSIPARAVGHSLGGVVAAYALIHLSNFFSDQLHETSYAFNFPGLKVDHSAYWNKLSKKPSFKGIITRGDIISKVGFLFGDIYEVSTENSLPLLSAHELLLFFQKKGFICPVDVEGENKCYSRTMYSSMHKKTSSILYRIGLKFLINT